MSEGEEETKEPLSLGDALAAFDQVKGMGLKAKPAPAVYVSPLREVEPDDVGDEGDALVDSHDDLRALQDEPADEEAEPEGEDDPAVAVEQIAKDLAKYSRRLLRTGSFEEARPLIAKGFDAVAEGLVAALDAVGTTEGSDIDAILVQRAIMTTSAFLQFLSANPKIARSWKRMLHDLPDDIRAMLERGLGGSLDQLEKAFRHVHEVTGVGFEEVARADGQDPEALKRMAAEAAKAHGG